MKKFTKDIAKIVILVCVVTMSTLCFACSSNTKENGDYEITTKLAAHRGFSSENPSNSYRAFLEAGKLQFWAIECDIWKTTDNKFVCCHNKNPFADTSINVETLDYSTATTTKPYKNNSSFLCGFEDYLDVCKTYNKIPLIDVKSTLSIETYNLIISFMDGIEEYYIMTPNINDLLLIKNDHSIKNLMCVTGDPNTASLAITNDIPVNILFTIVTNEMIVSAHEKGLIVGVWTINTNTYAYDMQKMGVDFIVTDYIW